MPIKIHEINLSRIEKENKKRLDQQVLSGWVELINKST